MTKLYKVTFGGIEQKQYVGAIIINNKYGIYAFIRFKQKLNQERFYLIFYFHVRLRFCNGRGHGSMQTIGSAFPYLLHGMRPKNIIRKESNL